MDADNVVSLTITVIISAVLILFGIICVVGGFRILNLAFRVVSRSPDKSPNNIQSFAFFILGLPIGVGVIGFGILMVVQLVIVGRYVIAVLTLP